MDGMIKTGEVSFLSTDPAPHELSERKKQILKAIIDAHIQGGEPVGSKYLVENKQIACSSATIRNEMAELEALGYLEQPHASAGRVPSERGYRFYVDSLIDHYAMTAREIGQINELLQQKMQELDQILVTASKVASNLTNYTGFAVKQKAQRVSVRRFDVVFLDERSLILVLVLSNDQVKTKTLHVGGEMPLSQAVTDQLAAALNEHLQNLCADQITLPIMIAIEQSMGSRAYIVSPVIKAIYETMNELDESTLRVSGVDRLLQYPEFSTPDRMKQVLGAIEQPDEILNVISGTEGGGANVIIGSESTVQVMNNSALVYIPIVKDGKNLGTVGVIGPARMDYAKVLATLEEISGNISSLLEDNDHHMADNRLTDGQNNGG